MKPRVLAVVLIGACGSSSPKVEPSPAPTPTPQPVPEPTPEPTPSPALAPVPLPLPDFALAGTDVDATYPLRAKIKLGGRIYVDHHGAAVDPGDDRDVLDETLVLDAGLDGNSDESLPRQVRLLCQSPAERIAVWMDATSLAEVPRETTFAGPTKVKPGAVDDRTPGLRLSAGAALTRVTEGDGIVNVAIEGDAMTGTGWVLTTSLDVVYHEPAYLAAAADAELAREVQVFDGSSGGTAFATIKNDENVQRLGKKKGARILVRHVDRDVTTIGWVDAKAVKAANVGAGDLGTSGTGAYAGAGPSLAVAAGTLLTSDTTGAVVGVVLKDTRYGCDDACDSDAPRLNVNACTGYARVRARKAPAP